MAGPHPETNQRLQMSYSSISLKLSTQFPHERLLLKLKGYGIEGNLLQWFKIFCQIANNAWWYVAPSPRGPILNPEYPREQS